ncbi:enoyl-CoA hydratase [Pollutimonas nitritireducens]|uniref:Enoyl-CoA hydratase n=1 Tax=Pollutimonas nitritireducens TaxID=2045209 RepID=A0A2N4UG10_9BURK|nr:enoyl-CoA hydratase/isomerase family protein [Pollutimonas nitritireducens]PLC53952.1 enoyl-CoA hydratase [Pollutimonas nitritireducens]
MQTTEKVRFEISDGLGVITLARPDKLNALDKDMRREFGAILAAAAEDAQIRVVLLRADGRAFCTGADMSAAPQSPLAWRERVLLAQSHHMQIVRMQKPVIAAVQGIALGGGASLALAADILVMADDAKLIFPFTRLGLVPDGGAAALLQAKSSPAIALDVLLSGGELTAHEAAAVGLTRRVVPAASLDEDALALARQLLELPAEGLVLTKALISHGWTTNLPNALAHEADALALAATTTGHRDAIARLRGKIELRKK